MSCKGIVLFSDKLNVHRPLATARSLLSVRRYALTASLIDETGASGLLAIVSIAARKADCNILGHKIDCITKASSNNAMSPSWETV